MSTPSGDVQFPHCRCCELPLEWLYVEEGPETKVRCPGCDFCADGNAVAQWWGLALQNFGENLHDDLQSRLERTLGGAVKISISHDIPQEIKNLCQQIILRMKK